jgi:hypothetical protein
MGGFAMIPKTSTRLNRDIQSILTAAAFAVATKPGKDTPAEPEEIEAHADFISPLLLAA